MYRRMLSYFYMYDRGGRVRLVTVKTLHAGLKLRFCWRMIVLARRVEIWLDALFSPFSNFRNWENNQILQISDERRRWGIVTGDGVFVSVSSFSRKKNKMFGTEVSTLTWQSVRVVTTLLLTGNFWGISDFQVVKWQLKCPENKHILDLYKCLTKTRIPNYLRVFFALYRPRENLKFHPSHYFSPSNGSLAIIAILNDHFITKRHKWHNHYWLFNVLVMVAHQGVNKKTPFRTRWNPPPIVRLY